MANKKTKRSHLDRILSQARLCLKRGWAVVPVPPKQKAPRFKGWTDLRLSEAELEEAFGPKHNIGVLLGEASGGLVDVDLDCAEALTLARDFLPKTERVHGRRSKPSSHLWYVVDPAPSPVKFIDIDGTALVEVRSTGQQTMVPPSVHPEGERFYWEQTGQPARVSPDVLRRAVARLAACVLLSRHWPSKGSRHETSMALAGFLLRAGKPPDWVEKFVMLTARASMRDEEWSARKHNVRTTVRRIAEGKTATGVPRLAELVGEPVVEKVKEWLGLRLPIEVGNSASFLTKVPQWPDAPDKKAFIGLPGEIVSTIAPHSEADRVALLGQTLVCFGNAVGRNPYFPVGSDRHYANQFAVLVGPTAKARKGLSWVDIHSLFSQADPQWSDNCIKSGLSTGEGLVWAVRDPVDRLKRVEREDGTIEYESERVDEGAKDKRLLAMEPEFAQPLKLMSRDNNILSTTLRQAWDSGVLRTLTKTNPANATEAHISVIAHITQQELRRYFTETEQANGFGNRFDWFCVRRSKFLPDGGQLPEDEKRKLIQKLKKSLNFARNVREVRRSNLAKELWHEIYPELSEGKLGLLGALTSRAEAHVTRLSMVYALMDCSAVIKKKHLEAALALWEYIEASTRFIFGDALGDSVADDLWSALRNVPEGMTRTDMSRHFKGHRSRAEIDRGLMVLVQAGFVNCRRVQTGGRPEERWFAVT